MVGFFFFFILSQIYPQNLPALLHILLYAELELSDITHIITPRACARGKVVRLLSLSLSSLSLLTPKRLDLDLQALFRAVMVLKLSKTAKNWLGLARKRMAVATRATIVAFVFTTPIGHTHSRLFSLCARFL